MTFILAHELRGRDITVNAVAPGSTATDMFLEGKDHELLTRLANAGPLERLGTPADIAPVVAFLAGPEGHWVMVRRSASTAGSSEITKEDHAGLPPGCGARRRPRPCIA
jgi:NAD(P)-dependent dehydrogenase (short-subunit alcohol dehydrogenase family)